MRCRWCGGVVAVPQDVRRKRAPLVSHLPPPRSGPVHVVGMIRHAKRDIAQGCPAAAAQEDNECLLRSVGVVLSRGDYPTATRLPFQHAQRNLTGFTLNTQHQHAAVRSTDLRVSMRVRRHTRAASHAGSCPARSSELPVNVWLHWGSHWLGSAPRCRCRVSVWLGRGRCGVRSGEGCPAPVNRARAQSQRPGRCAVVQSLCSLSADECCSQPSELQIYIISLWSLVCISLSVTAQAQATPQSHASTPTGTPAAQPRAALSTDRRITLLTFSVNFIIGVVLGIRPI